MRYGLFALAVFLAACGDGNGSPPPAQAVVDTTAPIVTLTGDNPQILAVGEAYVELGATASDNRDGDLTASIVIDASGVDSALLGEYAVTYDVSDTSGNAAATVTRTVIYQDQTAPVITLLGDDPQVIILRSPYVELGAEATDNVDGDLTAAVVIDATAVDASTPGDYTVTYDVTDAAGNAALTVTRSVTVLLPVPEKVSVSVEGDIKQLIFSWTEPGFVDYYRLLENADGHSGFTQLGDDIPAGTTVARREIAVHLFDWVEAQYLVEACNSRGCSASDVLTVTDLMLDTIGYFKASDTESWDHFGTAVGLDTDGDTLAVTTRHPFADRNGLYLFRHNGQRWYQYQKIEAQAGTGLVGCWEPAYLSEVVFSADGNTLIVGAPDYGGDPGCVAVFRFSGLTWELTEILEGSRDGIFYDSESGDYFGEAIALDTTGNFLAVGANNAGRVHLFHFDGVQWVQQGLLEFPSYTLFGFDVSLSADGQTLAVGALFEDSDKGAAYIFRFDGTDWVQEARIQPPNADDLYKPGYATVSLSADAKTLSIGAGYIRAGLWVYRFNGTDWEPDAYITAPNVDNGERFIGGVVLNPEGIMIAARARDDSGSTGINGDENDDSAFNSGAVYIFVFDGTTWRQKAYVKATNPDPDDWFGGGIAMTPDGTTLAVGAGGEDSAATGINGDSTDNSLNQAGAVYVY